MGEPLIVLVGPTASGKTEVALQLIGRFPLEIVSADSRQVYKFMDIGTGKPVEKDRHHLIDVVDPAQDFTVADYRLMAENVIGEIYRRNKIPLLVGGSGLYIRAVIDGLCPAPRADREIRKNLTEEAERSGNEFLYRKLKKVDPEAACRIHPNDRTRIIRALEVYTLTHKPISYFQKLTEKPLYSILMLGIRYPARILYQRINARVDKMIRQGLVEEVRGLMEKGFGQELKSMQGLGYKEVIGYINGRYPFEEMVRLIKRNTRRYAKRQMTWFRKDRRINWIEPKEENISYIVNEMSSYISKFLEPFTKAL